MIMRPERSGAPGAAPMICTQNSRVLESLYRIVDCRGLVRGIDRMKEDRRRILFLVSTLRQSGPTVQLLEIVRHLDHIRFEPVIVTLSVEPDRSMLKCFEDLGTRVKSLLLSRARGILHRGWREDIGRLVGTELDGRCVIHSQGIRADVILERAHRAD